MGTRLRRRHLADSISRPDKRAIGDPPRNRHPVLIGVLREDPPDHRSRHDVRPRADCSPRKTRVDLCSLPTVRQTRSSHARGQRIDRFREHGLFRS
jgi:hypothetical protein